MPRENLIPERMTDTDYDLDLIVIGGGINGAGIAREAAERGAKTCLLEQHDLCHGTSRWSSRLIHGGLRYLEYAEFSLVRESLREREILLKTAPHLVHPLPLLVPIYENARRGPRLVRIGMGLYDLLSLDKSLPSHRMLGPQEALELAPALHADGLAAAAHYHDAQVTWPERLVVENALAARLAGGVIRNYSRVDRLLHKHGRVRGVEYTDLRTGQMAQLTAPVVINAAGPWVDEVLTGLGPPVSRLMGGTKGSHIVVQPFAGAPSTACYIEARSDGRPFFVIPWQGLLLIGTTDIRFKDSPDAVMADTAEIDYLLNETNQVFPAAGLARSDVLYHYTGVRPLPYKPTGKEGAITRRHLLKHHRRFAKGLYSVVGGKLTTYRSLAEEAIDRVGHRLPVELARSASARRPLPGATRPRADARDELSARSTLSPQAIEHLLGTYGSRSVEVLRYLHDQPDLEQEICTHSHAIAAEIPFALQTEWATNLADVLLRRSMAGLAPDLGQAALEKSLEVGRRYLGWKPERCAAEEAGYRREIALLRTHATAS